MRCSSLERLASRISAELFHFFLVPGDSVVPGVTVVEFSGLSTASETFGLARLVFPVPLVLFLLARDFSMTETSSYLDGMIRASYASSIAEGPAMGPLDYMPCLP